MKIFTSIPVPFDVFRELGLWTLGVSGLLLVYNWDTRSKTTEKVDNTLKANGINRNTKTVKGNDKELPPKLIDHEIKEDTEKLVYKIPIGYDLSDFEKSKAAIESQLNSNININDQGNKIIIETYNLPDFYKYNLSEAKEQIKNKKLAMPLGKSSEGYLIHNFNDEPHLLVGGATKMGKTNGIRQGIVTMLHNYSKDYLNLNIVDLKRGVDTRILTHAPHTKELITERLEVLDFIDNMINKMNKRLDLLAEHNVDDISKLRQKVSQDLPNILIYFDEFADFRIDTKGDIKEYNEQVHYKIDVLASKCRAVGINLILATQRPIVAVIDGNIKNNFFARLALPVVSQHDSKTILDNNKAKELDSIKGRGLYQISKPIKFQFPLLEKDRAEKFLQQLSTSKTININHSNNTKTKTKENGDGINFGGEVL